MAEQEVVEQPEPEELDLFAPPEGDDVELDVTNTDIGGSGHSYIDNNNSALMTAADPDTTDTLIDFNFKKSQVLGGDIELAVGALANRNKQVALEDTLESEIADPEAVANLLQEDAANMDGPMSLQYQAALAMSNTTTEFEKEAVVRQFAGMQIATMMNDMSGLEGIVNYGALLIGLDLRKDVNDLTSAGIFNAKEGWAQFVGEFREKSPEDKIVALPALQQMLLVAFDANQVKVAGKMQQLVGLSPDESFDSDLFWDGVDWALLAAGPLIKAVKSTKTIKMAKDLENNELAGELTSAALLSDEAGEALNTTKVEAALSVSPFRWEEVMPGVTDGISHETIVAIEKVRKATQGHLEDLVEADKTITRAALTEAEQLSAQTKALDEFEEIAQKTKEDVGWSATDAQITGTSAEGFTVEYKLNDATGIALEAKPYRVSYVENDVGSMDLLAAGAIEVKVNSPSVWMNKILEGSVEKATAVGFTEGKFQNTLLSAFKTATKGVSRKDMAALDDVLLSGDEAGKVFTIDELRNLGINTATGTKRLNEKQVATYYAMRDLFDGMWWMKNNQIRRELEFKGNVSIGNFNGQRLIGKKSDSIPADVSRIYHNGDIVDLDDALKASLINSKSSYYRLSTRVEGADEFVEWGVASKSRDLPTTVMNKIGGYVPLVRKDATWFVKTNALRIVNGKKVAEPKTVRMFDNKTDAEAWAAKEKEATGEDHFTLFDREIGLDEQEDVVIKSMGGMYGSSRTEREILFGHNGDVPTRLNATQALERNMGHISNAVPMNEFRLELMTRWRNSAKGFLKNPDDFNSGLTVSGGSKEAIALEESRNWIQDQLRIPTLSEERWAGVARNAAVFMEGSDFFKSGLGKGARMGVQNLAHKDPISALRAGAFHGLLGWFNPAQLIVQSTGAAVALSLDPAAAPRILNQGLFLRAAVFLKNDQSLEMVANAAAKTGIDKADFLAMVGDYKKTGMIESLKTSADYAAAQGGFAIDAGSFKRVADSGLMFFREGELFSRSYAWMLARDKFIKANPKLKGKRLSDANIDEITSNSLRKTFNLNRANRAAWQTGALGSATQFMQINSKFMEAMLPMAIGGTGKFTPKERLNVMIGQMGLFGAAGVPMGAYMLRGAEEMTGGKISEDQAAVFEQGMVGMLISTVAGEPIEVATRTSLVSGIEQAVTNAIKGDSSFAELLVGASGAIPSRGFEAIANLTPIIKNFSELSLGKDEALLMATEFARVTSTFRNAHKAYMWAKLGEIRTASGDTIDRVDWGEDWKMIIGQGLGFSPTRVADAYDLQQYNKDVQGIRKDALVAVKKIYQDFLLGDTEDKARIRNKDVMLSSLYGTLHPSDAEKVKASWVESLQQPETILGKAYKQAFQHYVETGEMNPSILSKGLPQSVITRKEIRE